jgi:hypothetical protein
VACLPDGLHSAHRANSFAGSAAGTGSTTFTSISAPTASWQRGSDATCHAARKPSQDGHEAKDGFRMATQPFTFIAS